MTDTLWWAHAWRWMSAERTAGFTWNTRRGGAELVLEPSAWFHVEHTTESSSKKVLDRLGQAERATDARGVVVAVPD